MVQVIERNDIFGRIGKNIGEGFGERLEKEQDRRRLGQSLQSIEGLPPEIARLASVPGGTELLPTVAPYIQSQRQKQAVRPEGMQRQTGSMMGPASAQDKDLVPPKFDRKAPNYLIFTDPIELNQKAADESDRSGLPYQMVRERLEKEDKDRVSAEQAFETRTNLGRDELNKYTQTVLQKSGDERFSSIAGELLGKYETLVANDIAKGKSPLQAAKERGDELLDFAKTRQKIDLEAVKGYLGRNPTESEKIIKAARKKYEELGELELYRQDLIGKLGLSPKTASILSFPPAANKQIIPSIQNYRKNPAKSYANIKDNWKTNDSPLAIAAAIVENGGNGRKFLQDLIEDRDAGKIQLTDRQQQELLENFNTRDTLIDILYTTLWGKRAGV